MCGHIFDVSHSMTAKPRVKCPECGGRTKKNIGAGAGIIFKGSGFYETDYRRKPGNNDSKPAPKPVEPKKEEKKSDPKTDN
jgi:putative FmdB family regulatory protein